MSKHRARSRARITAVAAALTATAALGSALVVADANASDLLPAPPGKATLTKNSVVTAKCSLTVQSVDPQTYTTYTKLTTQAQPTSLFGYATNVYTQVFCAAKNSAGAVIAQYDPFVNSAYMPAEGQFFQLPYDTSYTVCAYAVVKLNNGVTSTTTETCA